MRLGQFVHARVHGGFSTLCPRAIRRPRVYEFTSAIAFGGIRHRVYDALIEAGGATDGDDVLDVGCGPGYLTKRLVRAVGAEGRLAGIDPSPEAIAYAKRGVPGKVDLRVAVAERLPYPDRSFDVVYCVLALHHIEPSQRLSALREMGRVLRADGTLLVAEFRPAPAADDSTDAIRDLTGLIAAAGFNVTGDGACHHRLRYVAAARS